MSPASIHSGCTKQCNVYKYYLLESLIFVRILYTFLLHSGPHSKLKVSLPEVMLNIRPSTITSLSPSTEPVADANRNP